MAEVVRPLVVRARLHVSLVHEAAELDELLDVDQLDGQVAERHELGLR